MPSWLLEDNELAQITEPPPPTGLDAENQQALLLIHEAMNDAQFERGRAILGLPPHHPLPGLTTQLVDDLRQLRSSAAKNGSGTTPPGMTPSMTCPDGSTSEYGYTTATSGTSQATTSMTSPQPDHHLDRPKPSPADVVAALITGSSIAPTIAAPHAESPSWGIIEENAQPIRSGSLRPRLLSPMEMQGITTPTPRPFEWP
ncbi:hypothetical protein WOLCODRAFT_156257 [Wolfiporia cocos MD-104 SS10]|uniref:Uncharacterized protein n=1 Tax=Wolfiporia cocos (strain MD-104) TaxID=742152 RepID=A0A2H3J007_WOLCO|nr:hypothetical protein WOLCODRAFT_156257 [Wolfiporia cocos MD-104 SS10]